MGGAAGGVADPASSCTMVQTPTEDPEEKEKDKPIHVLDSQDIKLLTSFGVGPYAESIKQLEDDIIKVSKNVDDARGIKESDTGLAAPSTWDLVADKQVMQQENPLQVARCTKIINADTENAQYVINVKQIAKFVVALGDNVSPMDIEEGMRVGVDRSGKYQIQLPLPPKIDAAVSLMMVEEKPDVTYNDVGGSKEQIDKLREVVELPMLHPERFINLGIDPPKGVLLYGPPGTGKTLAARAVANRTDACFIRVIGTWRNRVCTCIPIASARAFQCHLIDGMRGFEHRVATPLALACRRSRARAKVCGRGRSNGARAVPDGTL